MQAKLTQDQLRTAVKQMNNSLAYLERSTLNEVMWVENKTGKTFGMPMCSHMRPLLTQILIAHLREEIADVERELAAADGGTPSVQN